MDIHIENVHKSYYLDSGVEIKVLKGIDLIIESGKSLAIVGPSGAGKSTLLHILGLMDRPSEGTVRINNKDIAQLSDNERTFMRKSILGFIFQMHYLLPEFTVWENITIPIWDKRSKLRQHVDVLMNKLGIADRMNHLPSELSGGEQQRVALARALVHNPQLVLADEPTGNLDRETGEKVEEILFNECKSCGMTLICVTHNIELAQKADKVIRICDGLLTS